MFENKPSEWVNQSLYSYNCKTYGSYSTANLSILQNIKFNESNNIFNKKIEKSMFFLNLNIRSNADNRFKTYILKYPDIVDLYMSLNNASKDPNMYKNKTIITKRNSSKILEFEFAYSDNFNENLITITIRESENDFVYIILPMMEFICFYSLIKEFKAAYVSKSFDSVNDTIENEILINEINELKIEINQFKHIIYSIKDQFSEIGQMKNIILNENKEEIKNEEEDDINNESVDLETIKLNNDFENFTNDTIDTITIQALEDVERSYENEIKNIKPKDEFIDDTDSDLFNKLLHNDLKSINNLNEIIFNSSNYFNKLTEVLENNLDLKIGYRQYKSKDVKSHFYMSKLSIDAFTNDWEINNSQIPLNFPIMSFNIENMEIKNDDKILSLIYDLIFINIYIKCMRNKLSQKTEDQYSNYSFMNLKTRLFTDPLILLYKNFLNKSTLKNIITERYKKYSTKGYLIYCENDLSANNCTNVNISDITVAYDEYIKCLDINHFIKDIHCKGYDNKNFKVPYNNDFSFEQILNECIPCEIANHFKINDIKNITENIDILNLFEDKKILKKKIPGLYSSHLHRFISEIDFIKEIPENILDDFTEYVKNIENLSFDVDKFSLLDLGDNIVKAIYIWNNTTDEERGKGNYTSFRYNIESCMSKEMILASMKSNALYNDENDNDDKSWSENLQNNSQANNFSELMF